MGKTGEESCVLTGGWRLSESPSRSCARFWLSASPRPSPVSSRPPSEETGNDAVSDITEEQGDTVCFC